ncbi:hypothetical protein MMAD_18280 [Mycolicibacterium madagascariense]|uniref:PucR family transcriptional regulator n=1 Tax=Mycolicibacterium madagascariense TaxID=212765 RepID=A0A7I7XE79_9MYCO|nr:helix-turn-helix domain-containing protein [Mycolicibacterium madagascariense]MCV7015240.1 helix-turn-helix domain-containing protein [Mycolicibacterium madagascariense]BBZ27533.1 hypothetical protein MMAD_18280 [Mycolicibacterium madagascariense]
MTIDDDIARFAAAAAVEIDEKVAKILPTVRARSSADHLDDRETAWALTMTLRELLEVLQGQHAYDASALDEVISRRFDQGVTLLDLLHTYRIGVAAIWEEWAAMVDDEPADSKTLLAATPRIFEMVDRISQRANEIYRDLAVNSARRREQVRAALLDVLFGGDPAQGAPYWDAVGTLGIPRQGQFCVMEVTAANTTVVETDWEKIVAGSNAVEAAWFRLGPRSQVGLVSLNARRCDLTSLGQSVAERASATVGLSAPFRAVSDCRRARVQAATAAAATSTQRPVMRYGQDVLDVLMASSPEAANSLIDATIGSVLQLPADRALPLIETVRAWLENEQSVASTAVVMHCHRNTVNYRLRRFEALSGRSLSDNTWLAQVLLAVRSPGLTLSDAKGTRERE